MFEKQNSLFGIVGGMGPAATVYLQQLIVESIKVKNDQEHLPFLLFMNPQISSRQESNKHYLHDLITSINMLERAGATHIVFACYSAYIGVHRIKCQMRAKLIEVPSLAVEWISNNIPKQPIGILASPSVLKHRLFQNPLESLGFTVIHPSLEIQKKCVEKSIYDPYSGIKSGCKEEPKRMITKAIKHLESRGVSKILFGCTDLPVVYSTDSDKIIDPLRILVEHISNLYRETKNIEKQLTNIYGNTEVSTYE